MISRIDMIEGSSISDEIIKEVHEYAKPHKNILIFLDSNHTHQHVLEELRAYAPLVSKDSYCVVYDTIVEDLPADQFPNRSWGKGDNPKTALFQYLDEIKNSPVYGVDGEILNFSIDKEIEQKIQITVAPDGFLKRI
jgi:cephalosporin hydroxylase